MVDAEHVREELMNENSPVYWRAKLINMLRNNALNYDETEKRFTNLGTISPELLATASSQSDELNEVPDTIKGGQSPINNSEQRSIDVFICHASEDKDEIAVPLANKLNNLGVSVWIDKYRLRWGSSLFRKINEGLRNCRYGIVILSKSFFSKEWPEVELEALFSFMVSTGNELILPLRHKIRQEEITRNYPLLSGRLSYSSDVGVDTLAHDLVQILREDNKSVYTQNEQLISNDLDEINTNRLNYKKFQDVSEKELMSCISKINSTNHELREPGWRRLEKLALTKTLWNHDEIWQALNQILQNSHRQFLDNALMILKRMLSLAKEVSDSNINYASTETNRRYKDKISRIIQASDSIWVEYKPDAIQILEFITSEKERFTIYWQAWKNNVIEIIDDLQYRGSYQSFFRYLTSAREEYKNEIEPQLSEMMEDPDARVAKRAQQMYHELFER
jgi:hypothetical protein